jgi:hypothetical protein
MIFAKFISKWKAQWLIDHEAKLCKEFDGQIELLKDSLTATISEWNKKKDALIKEIERESAEFSLQQNEYSILLKKLEMSKKSVEDQVRLLEAKSSPTNVWTDAFTAGFNKAWDMMLPIMQEGVLKSKKVIEDTAIQETLKRINKGKKHYGTNS